MTDRPPDWKSHAERRAARQADVTTDATLLPSPLETGSLEKLVASRLGLPIRHVSVTEICEPRPSRRRRRFFKHVFVLGDSKGSTLSLFVKTEVRLSPQSVRLEEFLSELNIGQFRVPRFYGVFDLARRSHGGSAGVWQWVNGDCLPFRRTSPEMRRRIVQAAGAMSLLTKQVVESVPDIRVGARVGTNVSDMLSVVLKALAARGAETASLAEKADRFAHLEGQAAARLGHLERCFSHLDLTAKNLMFESGPASPWIVDWESARIAPHGSSLRAFAVLPTELQTDAARCYVEFMETNGVSLKATDVLFALRATQILTFMGDVVQFSTSAGPAAPWHGDALRPLEGRHERKLRWALSNADYLQCP